VRDHGEKGHGNVQKKKLGERAGAEAVGFSPKGEIPESAIAVKRTEGGG